MLTLFSKGQPKVQGFQYRTLINDEYQHCLPQQVSGVIDRTLINDEYNYISTVHLGTVSLIPRPSTPPAFDRFQYKNGGGRPGESSHVIRGTTVIHSHASYQQWKTCTRPILHSALARKMGQVPTESYTECMKRTQATRHDSKGLPSDKREMPSYDATFQWSEKTALFGVSPLVSQLSLSGFASNLDMSGFHLEKNVWGGSSGKCRAKCFEVN